MITIEDARLAIGGLTDTLGGQFVPFEAGALEAVMVQGRIYMANMAGIDATMMQIYMGGVVMGYHLALAEHRRLVGTEIFRDADHDTSEPR